MAVYKKKPMKPTKRKVKNLVVTEDIPMQKSAQKPIKEKASKKTVKHKPEVQKNPPESRIKVIKGKKNLHQKRRFAAVCAILALVLITVTVHFALPNGLFEYINNSFAKIGSGTGYPVMLTGGNIADVKGGGSYYLISSATNFEGYNSAGKNIFTYQHGYEKPVLKDSASRFMLYSQGDVQYSVFNLDKKLISGEMKNSILAANISDNGYYAIATVSDSYTSEVTVFNNKNKMVYQWFCSDYIISDVVLSADGKTLAVAVFNADGGTYNSKIYILKYSSADPVKLIEYNDTMIYSLKEYNNSGFFAIFNNKADFISFKNYSVTNYSFEKDIIYSRGNGSNSIIVTGNDANTANNTVFVFNRKGNKQTEFQINFEINDIALYNKHIYILSDKKLYMFDIKGNQLGSADCSFGVERIIPNSNRSVATITSGSVTQISFE